MVKNRRVNNKLEMLHLEYSNKELYMKLILWLRRNSILAASGWTKWNLSVKSLSIKLIQVFARHHPSLLRIQKEITVYLKLSRENSSFMYSLWCLPHTKGVDGQPSALGYSRLEFDSSWFVRSITLSNLSCVWANWGLTCIDLAI